MTLESALLVLGIEGICRWLGKQKWQLRSCPWRFLCGNSAVAFQSLACLRLSEERVGRTRRLYRHAALEGLVLTVGFGGSVGAREALICTERGEAAKRHDKDDTYLLQAVCALVVVGCYCHSSVY